MLLKLGLLISMAGFTQGDSVWFVDRSIHDLTGDGAADTIQLRGVDLSNGRSIIDLQIRTADGPTYRDQWTTFVYWGTDPDVEPAYDINWRLAVSDTLRRQLLHFEVGHVEGPEPASRWPNSGPRRQCRIECPSEPPDPRDYISQALTTAWLRDSLVTTGMTFSEASYRARWDEVGDAPRRDLDHVRRVAAAWADMYYRRSPTWSYWIGPYYEITVSWSRTEEAFVVVGGSG